MGYYEDALEWHGTANDMITCGRFRASVYMSCLAVECYLKFRVEMIQPNNPRLREHDSIYLYRLLKERYPSKKDLTTGIRLCRKYHSDARYSNTPKSEIYDQEFATRFIQIADDVKAYVDNECVATLDDLVKKYGKSSP